MNVDVQTVSVKIGDDPPRRLDKALTVYAPDEFNLSRSRIRRLIHSHAVSRDGVVHRDPDFRVSAGDNWQITLHCVSESSMPAEEIALDVVYEDADLIVIDKPPGLVVHPARGNRSGTLVNALLHHCGDSLRGIGHERRPGIVHRLDKDTSGLLVAAKSDSAMIGLAAQFEARSVKRRYLGLVRGVPGAPGSGFDGFGGVAFEENGVIRIEGDIGRHPSNRLKQAVVASGGRHAVTRCRVLERMLDGCASLAEFWLETGRTHQIRVHMARIGHPLVGDQLYGSGTRLLPREVEQDKREAMAKFPRQALHAATLEFNHPTSGEPARFESSLPVDIRDLHDTIADH